MRFVYPSQQSNFNTRALRHPQPQENSEHAQQISDSKTIHQKTAKGQAEYQQPVDNYKAIAWMGFHHGLFECG